MLRPSPTPSPRAQETSCTQDAYIIADGDVENGTALQQGRDADSAYAVASVDTVGDDTGTCKTAKQCIQLPSAAQMTALTVAERKVMEELDADGDGEINVSEVVAGVKRHAQVQQKVRQLRRRQLLFCAGMLIAMAVMFGVVFAANWQSKELFLSHMGAATGDRPVLVTRNDTVVSVAEMKATVPLYLTPFLASEHLREVQEVMYYDCLAGEEVWARVLSVRRQTAVVSESESDGVADDHAAMSELPTEERGDLATTATLVLASGRELIINAKGGELFFPSENRSQELCGELQCANVDLRLSTIADLEKRASEVLGESMGRRLQRGGRGGGGRGCRRCGGGGGRGGGGGGGRGGAPPPQRPEPTQPTQAPPVATTPLQQAIVSAATAISNIFANSDNTADALGGVVRLAFHDAGTFDSATNTGGADGCVDLTSPENSGLQEIVDTLQPIADSVQGTLSRADVWALAAGMSIEFAGGPSVDFQTGRLDATSCEGHGARLPDAELGRSHIIDIFISKLEFTERETAALMGAHVLGRAVRSVSGYNGNWVPNNDRFNNDYFQDLLARPWNRNSQQPFNGQARTQWNGPRTTMMLNTDIELAFDTSNGCTRAGGRPRRGQCPRATGMLSDAVTEFSRRGTGQAAFFQAFPPAFSKLMALGSAGLTCAFSDCATPGPF